MECWYMIYKNLLYTGMLFVVLPVWFGLLWVWYLKIEGTVRKLCNAWVLGLASMFASGQILLVPMILGKRTLTEAVTLWKIFLVIVSIVIMVILIRRCGILVTVENKLENKKKKAGAWKIIFGILAAALILLQAWIPNCSGGVFTYIFSIFYDHHLLCVVWNDRKCTVSR